MAQTALQTAQNDWRRRSTQFAQEGIPTSAWQQLYQRDMTGVYSGSQPMNDAEVYTAVQSAAKGPQIQDPQAQHGHGSGLTGILTGVANTFGNIPRDIGGIITGFPHGIAHAIWDLPQELPATFDLITHLGNDQWLVKNGYLAQGDHAHGLWGDFGQILRELNANQSENLLPYLPFLSDIANMTSGKGRAYLMQHPVGAMLDAWPAASWGGKLATAGKDFGQAAQVAEGLASGDNKFAAAGRALQKGNPAKAAISAMGDIIPGGRDVAGDTMTLRDRANHMARLMGITAKQRFGIMGPYSIAEQELYRSTDKYLQDNFGDIHVTPEQKEALFWGMHHIDPATHEPMTADQYNIWVDNLPPHMRAARDTFQNLAEAIRQTEVERGLIKEYTEPDGTKMYEPYNSPVYKAYKKWEDAREAAVAFKQRHPDVALTQEQGGEYIKLLDNAKKAKQSYYAAKANYVPLQGQLTAQAIFRKRVTDYVKAHPQHLQPGWSATGDIKEAYSEIAKSENIADFERLLGKQQTAKLISDSISEWRKLQKESGDITFLRHVTPEHIQQVLRPHIDPTDYHLPQQLKGLGKGIMLQRSIMDPVLALTYHQSELYRHDVVNQFIDQHLDPKDANGLSTGKGFVFNKQYIIDQYVDALRKAKTLGRNDFSDSRIATVAHNLYKENYTDWKPKALGGREAVGDQVIAKDMKAELDVLLGKKSPMLAMMTGNKIIRKGTALYKFSVLTGPRHLAHVTFGGLAFLLGRDTLAPRQFLTAAKLLRGDLHPEEFGLQGLTLSGLRGRVYQVGKSNLEVLHNQWMHAAGQRVGEDLKMEGLHEAKEKGLSVLEWFPNKLAKLEENVMDMYRVSAYLEEWQKRGGNPLEAGAALEQANKVFVDINNMSIMERTAVKQIFPFYAFTRHLFRYLFQYPVDYPLRASIITNFGEIEQNDWNNGLPRSYQSLLFLPFMSKIMGLSPGNEFSIDTKNINPFRSFSNDFSLAGFYSSLSPFLAAPLAAIGVDTLSGTTQLYPGVIYNPTTGSLQAQAPSGGLITSAEAFIPQLGLFDHYLGLTGATRSMARYSPDSYQKQLWNMLNMPFVPNIVNVPYYQEITEMRRFRAAQAAVTAVERDPSAANVAKLMEWNAVPFNNTLISPQSLAAYYTAVQAAMDKAHRPGIAPKAVLPTPPRRPATLASSTAPTS